MAPAFPIASGKQQTDAKDWVHTSHLMELAINIALLVAGTVMAIAAIGGDTWVKGHAPIHRRLTPRGWLSIACLFLTLLLGVVKEVRVSAARDDKERRLEAVAGELSKNSRTIAAFLEGRATRSDLAAAIGARDEAVIEHHRKVADDFNAATRVLEGLGRAIEGVKIEPSPSDPGGKDE